MGVTANFGIKSDVDSKAITALVDQLNFLASLAPKLAKMFEGVSTSATQTAERMSRSFVDAEGKITKARGDTTEKGKADINRLILAAEAARDREVKSAQEAEVKLAKLANDAYEAAFKALQKEEAATQAALDKEEKIRSDAAKRETDRQAALQRGLLLFEQKEAQNTKEYAELRAKYESESVDKIRVKIHAMNEDVRAQRKVTADTVQRLTQQGDLEGAKAIKAHSQLQINATEKELQQFRLLEHEKTGRTFAEMQERLRAETTTRTQIIVMMEEAAHKQESIEKQITATFDAEEKKRLKVALDEAKAETAAIQNEAEHRRIKAPEKEHGGGISLGQVEGLAVAAEGLATLVEKSKEVVEAEHMLQVGTGLSGEALKKAGEDAEELGNKLGVSGDNAKTTMGKVSSYTHATGEELNKQTEAVIAYAQAHGKSAEMVAKKLATASGQAEIFAEATVNVGKAQEAANEPAIRAQLTQEKLEETAGELASTLLQGLAPILTDLTPLIGTVGGIMADVLTPAMKVVSFVLSPLIEGLTTLKPILPELVVGLGALAVYMNAAAIAEGVLNAVSAVNPFVWIAAAVVALIGVVALLIKNWDAVVATLRKVWDTLSDVGSSVLSFLGITSKAEAATRKHTESLKENKLSLEEIKKAEEAAAKATSDYTDELKKNQDEQEKSAKEGQDNAIAAIVDIQKRLKTATGNEKAVLEERLAQWQNYGKAQVASQTETEDAKHKAALAIGAAVDNDQKKSKDKSAKIDKDAYTAAKNAEDIRFDNDKLDLERQLAAKTLTQDQFNSELEEKESVHVTNLKAIADAHRKGHEADAIKAEEALLQLTIKANNKVAVEAKKAADKVDADAKKAEALAESRAKTLETLDNEKEKTRVAAMKDGTEKSIAEEDLRYNEELVSREKDLMDLKTGKLVAEALETNHQNKLTALAQNGSDKRREQLLKESQYLAGPIAAGFNAGFKKITSGLDNWVKKGEDSNNILISGFATLAASFLDMVEQMIEKVIAMEAVLLVANLIPGFGAFMDSLSAIGSLIPGHAEGTDSSPGGWHVVGEKGPELLNMRPGAQVVPNHKLSSGGAVDMSPVVHAINALHATTAQGNSYLKNMPSPILRFGSSFENGRNNALKHEDRRARG